MTFQELKAPDGGVRLIFDPESKNIRMEHAPVQLDRITLGCICSYPAALGLMEAKIGRNNLISQALNRDRTESSDGRSRYPRSLRLKMYKHLISVIRQHQPELDISICFPTLRTSRIAG